MVVNPCLDRQKRKSRNQAKRPQANNMPQARVRIMRNPWTHEQIRLLHELYPHNRTADIVEAVGHPVDSIYHKVGSLGICKTAEFMDSEASGHFVKGKQSGAKTQFAKGGTPWNKGMKGVLKPASSSVKSIKRLISPETLDQMRDAMRKIMSDAYKAGEKAAHDVLKGE